jgi:anti-sigma factor ChrR (cupin superfamily)
MSAPSDSHRCDQSDRVLAYALQALPSHEAGAVEAHVSGCADCRHEMETLRPVVDTFVAWPRDVLRPTSSLWDRLAQRVAEETGGEPPLPASPRWADPEWKEVAPGISCKLLATDKDRDRVSMLVRLDPGVEYPPHCHGGIEELHLLSGVLLIDEKTLQPGDYIRAEAGSVDRRVLSETGCTCVLITSPSDVLR